MTTLTTSKNGQTFIAQETDESYPCRAATVQTLGTSSEKYLVLSFNNEANVERIRRDLQFVQHTIQPVCGTLTVGLDGADSIIVGLKALFKQEQRGWIDDVVSKPIISQAMQDALIDECSDFMMRAETAPSPDEF